MNPAAAASTSTIVGQSGPGSCAKHAVICRLHNAQATSNLQRIKDSADRSTYGPLAAAAVDSTGCRDYGALKDPSPSSAASLMRRWSVVRGLIEDPSKPTSRLTPSSYPCRSRYCLHSSRLQPQTIALSTNAAGVNDDPPTATGMMYFPLCSQQRHHHHHHHPGVPFIHSPPQSTYSCGQSGGKISDPPDVIASPDADTVFCSTAAEDQVAAWDWRTTTDENATNRDYFFTEPEKTTAPSNGNWMMTSHDVEGTKMTLLKQTTADNEIL